MHCIVIPAVVTVTTEERLLSRLFESYNRVARPVLHANETAQVYLSLGLSTIDELVRISLYQCYYLGKVSMEISTVLLSVVVIANMYFPVE